MSVSKTDQIVVRRKKISIEKFEKVISSYVSIEIDENVNIVSFTAMKVSK